MARTLDHHLHILLPGALGQFAQHLQFSKLGRIRGVVEAAGAQAVAQGEGDIVALADIQQLIVVGVEGVFLLMVQHPLGHQGAAAGDDLGDARIDQR